MLNLDAIKKQLTERLEALGAQVEEMENELRKPRSADWEEQATEVEGDEVLGTLEGSLLAEIEDIQKALQRIEDGTYANAPRAARTSGTGGWKHSLRQPVHQLRHVAGEVAEDFPAPA